MRGLYALRENATPPLRHVQGRGARGSGRAGTPAWPPYPSRRKRTLTQLRSIVGTADRHSALMNGVVGEMATLTPTCGTSDIQYLPTRFFLMAEPTKSETFEDIVAWAYSTLPEKIRELPDFPGIQVADEPPGEILKRRNRSTELL